jgi:hypothetical protein
VIGAGWFYFSVGANVVKVVIVMLLADTALVSTAVAAESNSPWSRGEGMRACLKNCISKIEKAASPTEEQRLACKNRCACIIDGMFEPGGKPKRDQSDLPKVAAECKARLQQTAVAQPERIDPQAAPAPVANPAVPIGAELLPGTTCNKAKLPSLQYDPGEHRVQLVGGGFKMRLPRGWSATLERPDLVVVSAAASVEGVRPVFEVFVSPVCKSYDGTSVHRRVAARGLIELLPPNATMDQVKKGSWSMGLGGPVGQNLVLKNVALKTAKGDRTVVLYSTQLADSKTFGLHAAAVCPKKTAEEGLGACEKTYFDMLEKADY